MNTSSGQFTKTISEWFIQNKRDLPWRGTNDPYKVWLSEIMLQQTRVKQGLPYYLKFINAFPTVFDLAEAEEEKILKLWQGLGYYSRARNLHHTARYIAEERQGEFPDNYKELLSLKGVGDYTASAIASICYEEPVAVVDGNVFRVLSRFFGMDQPIHSGMGKRVFKEKAEQTLDKDNPGLFNQAIMEFGAIQCKPKTPACEICPINKDCAAFQNGWIDRLPDTKKKKKVRTRHFNYVVYISEDGQTMLRQRKNKGIWRHLYEFPLIETQQEASLDDLCSRKEWGHTTVDEPPESYNKKPIKHQLSHQKLLIKFWFIRCKTLPEEQLKNANFATNIKDIGRFPVPVVLEKFISKAELG